MSSIIEESELGVHIYPNPSNGKVTIDWTARAAVEIAVSNLLGEVVWQEKLKSTQFSQTVDLSTQPSGVYLVHVKADSESVTKRIVLNR